MSVNDLVYLSNEGFHENYLAVAKCTDHDLGVCTVRRRETVFLLSFRIGKLEWNSCNTICL
ncbi:hypothetical protein M758_12G009700 [Ceratodon purpureus]|nr:hypothetical protein M758_12G009700 [Ceratodon purpureus]